MASDVGTAVRRRRKVDNELLTEVLHDWYDAGMVAEEAARAFGCSRSQLYRYLAEAKRRGLLEGEA